MPSPAGESHALRVLGIGAAVITLVAVGANVVWFARRGLGPLALLAVAGPLWLAVAAVLGGAGAVAYLSARAFSRPRSDRPPKDPPQGG